MEIGIDVDVWKLVRLLGEVFDLINRVIYFFNFIGIVIVVFEGKSYLGYFILFFFCFVGSVNKECLDI